MRLIALACGAALVAAGCGGDSDEPVAPLRDGVYTFKLTERYMVENGIGTQIAKDEGGNHTVTLDKGSFVDRWITESGGIGSCEGTYSRDGDEVTFRWTRGCFGDWTMRNTVEGNTVTWDDIDVLPPYDDDIEQKLAEVMNSVPWTRVGDGS